MIWAAAMAGSWSRLPSYGCQEVGYDIDEECVQLSLENVKKIHVEKLVRIEHEDIFKVDLSKADVVTLYLLPSLNVKLIPQLEKLKPGSRIVSHAFGMKGIKPDKVIPFSASVTRALSGEGRSQGRGLKIECIVDGPRGHPPSGHSEGESK